MSPADRELTDFLAGKPIDIGPTLRALPRGANLELAVAAVLRLIDHPRWLASSCAVMPAAVVRAVLATPHPGVAHLFLCLAVPSDAKAPALKSTWRSAVLALRDLDDTTQDWAARAATLARKPRVLAAVQGVVAHTPHVKLDWLAILAIDGSAASVDALIPHLDPALVERSARLERLVQLRACARRTPALDALFAEVATAVDEYRKTSPALALATTIGGLGTPDRFWFHLMLTSNQCSAAKIPRVQGGVRVDSSEVPWFTVWLAVVAPTIDRSGDRETRFDDARVVEDGIGVGRCTAAALPAWLAATATRLNITWRPFLVRTSAIPKRVTDWLGAT